MTKISVYNIDENVTADDKWIGTDVNTYNKTKNFTPKKLSNYFNGSQVINTGVDLLYKYLYNRTTGTLSFETNIGSEINFSTISTFLLSKTTLKGNDVVEFFDFLVGTKVLLYKAKNINIFGYYSVVSIEEYIPDPNFFVVNVNFIEGNGFIEVEEDYMISLIDVSAGGGSQNLQEVTNLGSTTTNPITANSFVKSGGTGTNILLDDGNTVALSSIGGNTNLSSSQTASNFTINSDTGTDATIPLGNGTLAGATLNDYTTAEKTKLSGIAPGANVGVVPNSPITGATKTKITYDSKGLVTAGVDATTADITDSTNKRYVTDANLTVLGNTSGTNTGDQNLQQVTDLDATTTNNIQFIDSAEVLFGAGGGILLDNTSRLREGTIDAGLGGSKGIAQICGVGYELKWEAGRLYVMNGNGNGIRESLYNFNIVPTVDDDNTKAYYQGSLWSLDNGDVYECSDATTGAAVWDLKNTGGTPTLQQVTDEGATTTNSITAAEFIKDGGFDFQFLKADGSVDNNAYLTSADLPSTLDLYATTTASDISGYTVLVRNIADSRYNTVAVDVPTPTITGTLESPTFCGAVISDPSVLLGNPGVFNFSVIGKIRRSGGSTSSGADFFYSIYKRDLAGAETLIANSAPVVVPANGGIYVEYISIALWNNGIFLSTDRIVLKFYGVQTGGGTGATYEFQFGGADPVRGTAAISSAIIPNIYLRDLADVEKTDALNNEVLYWNDTASLWEHSLVVDLTPDASAIQRGLVSIGAQTFAGDKTFTGAIGASNLSGTNTGDNATNTQYSGLATSKQDVITLTTTGTSGASTLIGATLNIPQYSGATNLGYTAAPTNGTVTSSTGTSATLPLADATNAGLLKPAKFTVLENTSGTNTGDQDLSGLISKNIAANYTTNAITTVTAAEYAAFVTAGTISSTTLYFITA